jgi:hypothetical protein
LPPPQEGDVYMKSNWLESEPLGLAKLTRRDSITKINSPSLTTIKQLVDLVNGDRQEQSRINFAWNFCNLLGETGTIEFRKPPQCIDGEEVLDWAELTLSFIQAAVGCPSVEKLLEIPSTAEGLLWFLKKFEVRGVNEGRRLQGLFADLEVNSARRPVAKLGLAQLAQRRDIESFLSQLAREDLEEIRRFAAKARPPYWKEGAGSVVKEGEHKR